MRRLSLSLLPLIIAIAAPAVAMAQTAPAAETPPAVEPVRTGDRTLGSATAPVTLTVYLSTTCGHCADWHLNDFPAFKAKYVDTGKVRVAYRDLPTPPAQLSYAGIVMSRCVPEDRYDAALDALFAGQDAVQGAGGSRPAAVAWLRAAGLAGGLTIEQMNACMASDAGFAEAEARAVQSDADGVGSTPTFLINGKPIPEGAMTSRGVEAFDPLIQPLLAGR